MPRSSNLQKRHLAHKKQKNRNKHSKRQKKYVQYASSSASESDSDSDSSDSDLLATDDEDDPDYYNGEDRKRFIDPSERLLPWLVFYGIQAPALIVIDVIWWSQYQWHPSVNHRFFILTPTELMLMHAVVITFIGAMAVYIWWVEFIGSRLCGCCCRLTTFSCRLAVFDVFCSAAMTVSLGKPFFFHNPDDTHWPHGLNSTFLLAMLSGVLCFFGSLKFTMVSHRLSTMKLPKHRTYGAKFSLIEEGWGGEMTGGGKAGSGTGTDSGSGGEYEYEMTAPKDSNARPPTTATATHDQRIQNLHLQLQQTNQKYRVSLRPLDPMPPVTPSEFEQMWSTRWGASTTVVYTTGIKPNAFEICESLEEHNLHVLAKSTSKLYFVGQEILYNLETQRPGAGYNTARRTQSSGGAWSLSSGETSPLVICEMRFMSKEKICVELRCDDHSVSNLISLYIELYETILRREHGVYKKQCL